MLDLLFTLGAVAESRTQFGPDYGYQLAAQGVSQPAPSSDAETQSWQPPAMRFDDSQDCLTFLERRVAGFGILRISQRCSESEQPVPWRSL